MTPNKSELLTKAESARELRVCIRTIENLIAARAIAVVRIGRSVRIECAELERFIASRRVEAVR